MGAFAAVLVAAIPNVLMAIMGKLVTETFMQSVLEKVLIVGLKKAASLSTNTLDDELVTDIEKRLKGGAA